jgi:endonuclease-3
VEGLEETEAAKRNYAKKILERLKRKYKSELHTHLTYSNLTQLFVAALLSPQCTDTQTNKVTSELFKHFSTFEDYANTSTKTLQKYLSGLNYYKTKAKHLKLASKMIIEKYKGKVPKGMKELTALPGIGRKVANVILHEGFGINEGIAVDTHVKTTAYRLGLTRSKEPTKIEKDLMGLFPRSEWGNLSNALIALGRDTCKARNKECERCVLGDICPSSTAKISHGQAAKEKAKQYQNLL